MRKLIFLLVAITLPVFAFKMNAEENEVKEIPLERKADKRLERTSFIVSIESCYNGMLSSVVTTISEDLGEVTLTVTNLSTGESFCDTFNSGSTPQVLTLISRTSGYYEVSYLTEFGDIYEGNFILE